MTPSLRPLKEREEEKVERAILAHVFAAQPHCRTFLELAREFGDREEVMKALCSLADYGLVQFNGGVSESIQPTLAARRCHRLESL